MVDKETGKLHADILEIIDVCKVERIVWLTDADCRSLSSKEITPDNDLYKRVFGFYSSISKFQDLLSSNENIKLFFAHINENLDCKSKGLDDLLIAHPDHSAEIISEALNFDTMGAGKYTGNYFTKFNISHLIEMNLL
jgi:hypothetical protein